MECVETISSFDAGQKPISCLRLQKVLEDAIEAIAGKLKLKLRSEKDSDSVDASQRQS
ncbi:uncharacterized protein G2W53_039488 [Senna tora]|uniref:Uncharacterized protein n=1 Tax=Senna tora TaxID=362788 RepID=A0A834SPB7_9FABA|nr:uncharacterized protein G2W53_039488 [Senna tora]